MAQEKTWLFSERENRLAQILLGIFLVLAAIWIIIYIPKYQFAHLQVAHLSETLGPAEIFELENKARQTIVQLFGGVLVIVGIFIAWRRVLVAHEGQITERFTRAIDQLGAVGEKGEQRIEIRLGGIYALERIARDSQKDHPQIMEVLTAYVRNNAQRKEKESGADEQTTEPRTDIQAILTVIGRRKWAEKEKDPLDLSNTDLRRSNLFKANLLEAALWGTNLWRANLRGANLREANLWEADLREADLREAYLLEANLQGAYLLGANLQGAYLRGAYLRGAQFESEAILQTRNWQSATFDAGIMEQLEQLNEERQQGGSPPSGEGSNGQ